MKNFTDQLVDMIIENERSRLDKIMQYTTEQISKDFAFVMMRLLDMYYDNYDPTSYVRIYGKRGKYMSGRRPKVTHGSLHAAVSRDDGRLERSGGTLKLGEDQASYVGGIEFDENNFKNSSDIYHRKKGIEEWNIVENFLYAGDGVGKGDWRSVDENYSAPSPDELMNSYMDNYGSMFDRHYNNALKKFS
jgi:hypothetical protein